MNQASSGGLTELMPRRFALDGLSDDVEDGEIPRLYAVINMASITVPCLLLSLTSTFAGDDELSIERHVESLIQIQIKDRFDTKTRKDADEEMLALAKKYPQAVAHLVKLLEDKERLTRYYAASYLLRNGKAENGVVSGLARMLHNNKEQKDNRRMACSALAMLGPPAIPALLKGLDDPDANIRGCVADQLQRLVEHPEGRTVIPALISVRR